MLSGMQLLRRWRRRKSAGDPDLDERTRTANETFRAQHDGLQGRAQPAVDRWQRRTDDEFKPPSY
jgi:hypothetical protein